MKKIVIFFTFALFVQFGANAAVCSKLNLSRCLDSACAINIGANPGARCQLCGTSKAGSFQNDNGIQQLSVGVSSKMILSDSELRSAPPDPVDRYSWAANACIKKTPGCTVSDVSGIYDKLIEQSCVAAGVDAQLAVLNSASKKTKTKTSCESEINLCMYDSKRCGADFNNCTDNSDFDKYFAQCSVNANGCDSFLNDLRGKIIASRDSAISQKTMLAQNIADAYKNARDLKTQSAIDSCKDGSAQKLCVKTVCENNMINKCGPGFESEKSMATLMCKFQELACARLGVR